VPPVLASEQRRSPAKEVLNVPLILWLLGVPGIIVILLWVTGVISF
jgi:hypothetical protein